jgi:hypothetical protein
VLEIELYKRKSALICKGRRISMFYEESWLKSPPTDEHFAFEEDLCRYGPTQPLTRHFKILEEGCSPWGRLQGHFIIFYEVLTHFNERNSGSMSFSIIFYCIVVEDELYKRKSALICKGRSSRG